MFKVTAILEEMAQYTFAIPKWHVQIHLDSQYFCLFIFSPPPCSQHTLSLPPLESLNAH